MNAPGTSARGLRFALVVSLILHLLVLAAGSPPVLLTKDSPPPLAATLRHSKPAAVPPAPTFSPPPASQPKPPPAPAPVLERPRPLSVPSPSPIAVPPAQTPQAAPVQAPSAPVAAPSVPAVPAAASAASTLTEGSASGEAVDGLRGYRLALASQARRFKRYPAQAMASGWTGTADVRVEVGSDGRPRAAQLVKSSGHEALDRAAIAMIDAGALRARVPDSLRGKAFAVVLPVVFDLSGE